jgi:spore maturation protein CgeB
VITDKTDIYTVETKKGMPSLKMRAEDGTIKTVHSLYDPESEARTMVEAFQFDGRGLLVVLGLGLGYHVVEFIRRYPDAEIVVVEASSGIYELAREQGRLPEDNIRFITGSSPEDVLKEITGHQMKDGIKPLAVFALSPVVSAFSSYYQPIFNALKKTVSVRLWNRLRYRKFSNEAVNVLLVDTGYFLVREAEETLVSLGHKVKKISVSKDTPSNALISNIVQSIIDFRPDFILTINHLGFDEEGALTSFLRSIEMPASSWYVDSPRLIMQAFDRNVSPYTAMFLWDRKYTGIMRDLGFESVEYLPLATDERIFRPLKLKQHTLREYQADAGFVGNSLLDATREKFERIPAEYHPAIERAALRMREGKESFADAIRGEPDAYGRLTQRLMLDIEAAVLWKASLLYRLSCVEQLKGFNPHIYGDDGWKKLLKGNYRIKHQLNYYHELPLLYNACRINFNATHLQMGEAVNQRVFDVPACGAFLLTDHQSSLNELFDVGKEIVVYKNKDEIPELVKHYLNNSRKREDIARKGRERVLREHTYKQRIGSLIEFMKERFR